MKTNIFDRLYDFYINYMNLKSDKKSMWRAMGQYNLDVHKFLLKRSVYEDALKDFASCDHEKLKVMCVGAGINYFSPVPGEDKVYDETIDKIEKIYKQTTGFSLEDIAVFPFCGITGKPIGDKVLHQACYRLGYSLSKIKPFLNHSGKKVVLEIGAGWGCLSNLVLNNIPDVSYVVVDIASSAVVSSYYNHCVGRKICFYGEYDNLSDAILNNDIVVIPPIEMKNIPDDFVDVVINTNSMTEMYLDAIVYYANNINRICKGYFYNDNYPKSLDKQGKLGLNELCSNHMDSFNLVYERVQRFVFFDVDWDFAALTGIGNHFVEALFVKNRFSKKYLGL